MPGSNSSSQLYSAPGTPTTPLTPSAISSLGSNVAGGSSTRLLLRGRSESASAVGLAGIAEEFGTSPSSQQQYLGFGQGTPQLLSHSYQQQGHTYMGASGNGSAHSPSAMAAPQQQAGHLSSQQFLTSSTPQQQAPYFYSAAQQQHITSPTTTTFGECVSSHAAAYLAEDGREHRPALTSSHEQVQQRHSLAASGAADLTDGSRSLASSVENPATSARVPIQVQGPRLQQQLAAYGGASSVVYTRTGPAASGVPVHSQKEVQSVSVAVDHGLRLQQQHGEFGEGEEENEGEVPAAGAFAIMSGRLSAHHEGLTQSPIVQQLPARVGTDSGHTDTDQVCVCTCVRACVCVYVAAGYCVDR